MTNPCPAVARTTDVWSRIDELCAPDESADETRLGDSSWRKQGQVVEKVANMSSTFGFRCRHFQGETVSSCIRRAHSNVGNHRRKLGSFDTGWVLKPRFTVRMKKYHHQTHQQQKLDGHRHVGSASFALFLLGVAEPTTSDSMKVGAPAPHLGFIRVSRHNHCPIRASVLTSKAEGLARYCRAHVALVSAQCSTKRLRWMGEGLDSAQAAPTRHGAPPVANCHRLEALTIRPSRHPTRSHEIDLDVRDEKSCDCWAPVLPPPAMQDPLA